MTQRDYYEILSVERTADNETIKKAYRKIAFQYHPDRNPDNEDAVNRFKEAAEAYEVLQNAEKRTLYDRFGHSGLNNQGRNFSSQEDIFSHFSDIFSDLFGFSQAGGAGRTQRARAGSDLRYDLEITFRQAAKGDDIKLNIPRSKTCDYCSGSGAAPGTSPQVCSQCGGSGQHQRPGLE